MAKNGLFCYILLLLSQPPTFGQSRAAARSAHAWIHFCTSELWEDIPIPYCLGPCSFSHAQQNSTVSHPVRAWKTECPCLLWSEAIDLPDTADSFKIQTATTVHLQPEYCQFPGISIVDAPLPCDNVLISSVLLFLLAQRVTISTV